MDFGIVHCCSRCGAPIDRHQHTLEARLHLADCRKPHFTSVFRLFKVYGLCVCNWIGQKLKRHG
jgi:hypothetical protein